MVSAKDRIINSLKPSRRNKFPKGKTKLGSVGYDNVRDDIESAKHLREGTIQHTPANAKDITNKEYVDNNVNIIDIIVVLDAAVTTLDGNVLILK